MDKQIQVKQDELQCAGWKAVPIGQTRSNGKLKQAEGFQVFVRDRNFDDFLKKSSKEDTSNPCKQKGLGTGSGFPMGTPKGSPTLPESSPSGIPPLADFVSYPSLRAARPDNPCIMIGFDSEWENLDSGRRSMLSWQFATVWNGRVIEACFLKDGNRNLDLNTVIGFLFDYLELKPVDVRKIRRYKYCSRWADGKPDVTETASLDEARKNCVYVYRGCNGEGMFSRERIFDMPDHSVKRSARDWSYFHTFLSYKSVESTKITLVCHAGKADLTSLNGAGDMLLHLTEVQGGLVSLQPMRMAPRSLKSVNNTSVYPVSLSVADTMCHAPAGMKKLKNLGNVVGIQKIDIPDRQKEHMRRLLENDPVTFFEYASTDSVVTLMYASALYGWNNRPPVTITSAAAYVLKENIMDYMAIEHNDIDGFNLKYRGLIKISHGKVKLPDQPGFCESTSLEPVSDKACTIQGYASRAYHGGYNGCSEAGYFPIETHDYDLRNAYPTSMCLVTDIDWGNPIRLHIQNRLMDIRDFQTPCNGMNPIAPFVGYCRFRFPDSVKFPCIPVNVDGVPVYPRSSDGLDGVYAAGPYIYLALQLGSDVYCENGYFLNSLYTSDGGESCSLSYAVKQFVQDRNLAVAEHGKKSIQDLILKTMVNSGYGKIAQNVVEKHTWSAYKDIMEDLGSSAITNPVSAMMTTAIVQCALLACQNQLYSLGYMSCSVTTDGFISDVPYEELVRLDLFGLRPCMMQARLFLTDGKDAEIWEEKHHQNDLVNFTTRGNVSLLPYGVCAHNSAKSGFESDSYEDRLWLMTQVLGRTGTVDCVGQKWPSFKDIVQGKTDFCVRPEIRHLHMDFDLKRKPDRDSFSTDYPVVCGITYEIAHFDTVPYENVAEFRLYRKKKESCGCLRTAREWDAFFLKVDTDNCGCIVKDLEWSILLSVIMGYRSGKWDIPALDRKTVAEKCAWINQHNESTRKFKESDWKNARRPERQVHMLPAEFLKVKLEELQNSD